jgi:zinc protease
MTVKPYPSIAAATVKLDRAVLPPLAQAPEIKFPQVQRNRLKNGLNVVLLERHSAPIVNVTIAADAGYASDATGKAGTASLALDLMDEGTKTMDAFQISNQLDLLGATLNSFSQLDLSFVRLGATSKNLRPSLKILSDVVLNPSFPTDQFGLKKQQRLSQIGQEKSQASGAALRILPQLLFGANHNYSNPLSGSGYETSVQTIQRADLIDWHSKWFKPGSSTVIVTGDVTMDKLMPALEEAFAGWTAGNAPAKNIAVVDKTKGGKVYLIDKPDAPQSTIIAAHISEASGQPEDVAIQTVMQNFGGMATSRLNRNLRLDKHWSYGTNGALMTARGQRPFLVIAPVQTDKTKESMVEVIKEIKGVAGERELAGEEYESIMRNMTLRLPARFSTLSALESAATEMINYKLPDDYWSRYAERVRGLTAPALNEAAKKYVHPSDIIWIVVGDRKKIESGIKSLNYGEVILLNTDGKVISE